MMRGDVGKDRRECANFERAVVGNGLVILTISIRGHADMRPCLPDRTIPKHAQCPDQFIRIKIAWQPVSRQVS